MAAFEVIGRGSSANDGTGDPARDWALKTNNNFAKAANIEESNTFQAANTHSGNDIFNGDNTFNGADVHNGDDTFNGNVTFTDDVDITGTVLRTLTMKGSSSNNSDVSKIIGISDTIGRQTEIVTYRGGTSNNMGIKILTYNAAVFTPLDLNPNGTIMALPTYNNTTANAANVYIDSSGLLYRSTSTEELKKDIEQIDPEYSSKIYKIAKEAAIFYKSRSEKDNPNHTFYGISAEKLAGIEPRLVFWGYLPKDYEIVDDIYFEEVADETGETKKIKRVRKLQKVKKDAKLVPVGVQYERFVPLMLVEMNKQNEELESLKKEIAEIKKLIKK